MSEIISWFTANYSSLLAIFGSIVAIASVVVKLTPNTKDDEWFNKIVSILEKFSLFNKDGSMSK